MLQLMAAQAGLQGRAGHCNECTTCPLSPASEEEQMVLQAGRAGLPLAESLREAKDLEARS